MKKYDIFIIEQNTDKEETKWKLIIDISKIWKQYETNTVSIEQFNNAYIQFLKNNKNIIIEKTNTWDKLNDIISRLEEKKDNEQNCLSIWDDIYDWGDNNLVEIKTQNKKDF